MSFLCFFSSEVPIFVPESWSGISNLKEYRESERWERLEGEVATGRSNTKEGVRDGKEAGDKTSIKIGS